MKRVFTFTIIFGVFGIIIFAIIHFSGSGSEVSPLQPAAPSNSSVVTSTNSSTTTPQIDINDIDGDGVSNEEEQARGLDQKEYDTDRDGLADNIEIQQTNTDPTIKDTDGDGLTDGQEILLFSTDPNNEDTDGDGYIDGMEVNNGYNPNGSGTL